MLWVADAISQLGTQITFLGLPLVAVITLHAAPLQVGALQAVAFLPVVLVSLPLGAWVDRLSRGRVMIASDLGRALLLAVIPIAFLLGDLSIWLLYVITFAGGILDVAFDVASQSFLPSLLQRAQLVEGNAKLEITRSAARIAGPGMAGALIQLLTAPLAILLDALSFVGSATVLSLIERPQVIQVATVEQTSSHLLDEIRHGLRSVLSDHVLRASAAASALLNLGTAAIDAIFLLYIVRNLGLNAGIIGLIIGLGNLGLLAGALFASRVASRLGVGRTIALALGLHGLGLLLFPLAPRAAPLPFLIAGQVARSFGIVAYNVNTAGVRQAMTPEGIRGRVNATTRFLSWNTIPLGALLGGFAGGSLGLVPTLWIGAAVALLAAVPPLFSPLVALRALPDPA